MAYRIIPGFSSGRTDLPLIQRDKLIDAGTIDLFDFNHGWGYPAMATPIAAATAFKNYVRGGADLVNDGGAKTWSGGKISFSGRNQNSKLALPNAWKLPTSATHFAIGFVLTLPFTTPAGTGSSSINGEIFGCWDIGGTARQYAMYTTFDSGTGNVTGVFVTVNGTAFNVTSAIPTDGAKHFYAIEYTLLSATTWNMKLWVDGAMAYTSSTITSTGAFMGAGANIPAIGTYYSSGTASFVSATFGIGRIWLQDLSVAGSKTIAALTAADIAANASRFI